MKVIEIELVKSEFSEENSYKIVLNEKHETDVAIKSYEPTFSKNKFEILSSNFKEMKEFLTVTIISLNNGMETVKGKEIVELAYGKDLVSHSVEFNKLRGASVDGVVHFNYKLFKQTLSESLKNSNGICCLSINAAYLNVVMEKSFDLKILIKDFLGSVLGTARLNNRSPAFYLDMDRTPEDHPVELVVSDSSGLYSIMVRPGCPTATAIPLLTGDSLLITTQLVVGSGVVTGMLHSSALREASVSTTTAGKRISLSPRRPSVMLPVGLGASPGGELAAKKSLLFLEDQLLADSKSASPVSVLEGVQQAMFISVAQSQSPLSKERLSAEILGPRSGAYVTCSSKNEILLDSAADVGKKKSSKKNKKHLHVINLGLVSVHVSSLQNPVKLRAELLDYLLEPHIPGLSSATSSPVKQQTPKNFSSDSNDNPEIVAPPPNANESVVPIGTPRSVVLARPTLAFAGLLEETSRELFNETGFVAVVLEGKLFRQAHVLAQGATLSGSGTSPRASSEESCMAVKVYLSLVPSSPVVEQALDNKHVKGDSLQTLSESVSEKDIFAIDSEILDFGGYARNKGGRLEAVSETEPFNVVTADSAMPDELVGSSVLSAPLLAETQAPPQTGSSQYGSLEKATSSAQFGEQLDPKHILHLQQLELEDQQRSRMIASNNAFAEIVRGELVEKQKLVERLMQEVKVRTEAIQVVGKDIRELRQEKTHFLDKIQSLEEELAKKLQAEQTTNQMTERMLKSNTALQEMDRDTLIRLLNQLRDALNASEGEKVQLQAVLRSAKTSIDEFAVMKRDYRELQVAHTEQTRYLQKMQTKINQADVYRGTIATQEGVIASMQSAIEAKIHKHRGLDRQLLLPRPPKRPPVDDNSINTTERSAVESKLHEASQQVSTLEQRVRELEEQLELAKYAHVEEEEDDTQDETGQESSDEDENEEEEEEAKKGGDQSLETDRKIDQLEAELVSKGFRIAALEKQLETSTVDYSREIARLRTKLFELEINSSLMAGDADGSFLDFLADDDNASNSSSRRGSVSDNRRNSPPREVGASPSPSPAATGLADSLNIKQVTKDGASSGDGAASADSPEHTSPVSMNAPDAASKPAVDTVVERTIDVLDASAEGNRIKCADLTLRMRHEYDPSSKTSRFTFQHIEIHGFQQSESKAKFQPHLVLSMPSADWRKKTSTEMDAGPNVIWRFDQEEMMLTMTDDQLQRGATLQVDVNKVNIKSDSDFLIGTCTLSLLF